MASDSALNLPPLDVYRTPFVVPIGHLTMHAAFADEELVNLCAGIPFEGSPDQMEPADVAHELRNWNGAAERFVMSRIGLIRDDYWRSQACDAVERFLALRERRHRIIHDAISMGLFHEDGGYVARALSVQYKRESGRTTMLLNQITPREVAALACEFYELHRDLDMIHGAVRDSNVPK